MMVREINVLNSFTQLNDSYNGTSEGEQTDDYTQSEMKQLHQIGQHRYRTK